MVDVADVAELDLRDPELAGEVLALQREAYAVEAALIGFDGIPQLTETLDGLRASGERWLGLRDAGGLVAAVAWNRLDGGVLDVCRLVVATRAHRRGYATALLDALDARQPAELTVVSTGTANTPARRLYERRGFVPVAEREIGPGVTVTEMERRTSPGDGWQAGRARG